MSIAEQLAVLRVWAAGAVAEGLTDPVPIIPIVFSGEGTRIDLTPAEIVAGIDDGSLAATLGTDDGIAGQFPDIDAALAQALRYLADEVPGREGRLLITGGDFDEWADVTDPTEFGPPEPDPPPGGPLPAPPEPPGCGSALTPFTVTGATLTSPVIASVTGLAADSTVTALEVSFRNDSPLQAEARVAVHIDTAPVDSTVSRRVALVNGGTLAPGEATTVSVAMTGREISGDTGAAFPEARYFLAAVVDANSPIAGEQLDCNTGEAEMVFDADAGAPPPAGRYALSGLSVSPFWDVGRTVSISLFVTNEGDVALSGGRVRIGADAVQNGAAEPPGQRGALPILVLDIPDLAPGETVRLSDAREARLFAPFMTEAGRLAVGNIDRVGNADRFRHEIVARVDPAGQPQKTEDLSIGGQLAARQRAAKTIVTSEDFNRLLRRIGVGGTGADPDGPGLPPGDAFDEAGHNWEVTTFAVSPTLWQPATEVTVDWALRNAGESPSPATSLSFRAIGTRPAAEFARGQIPPLAPGETWSGSFDIVPGSLGGTIPPWGVANPFLSNPDPVDYDIEMLIAPDLPKLGPFRADDSATVAVQVGRELNRIFFNGGEFTTPDVTRPTTPTPGTPGGAPPPPPPAPRPPVAIDDAASTVEGQAVTIPVLANDSDPQGRQLLVVANSDPANGTATVAGDDTITYAPDPGFSGEDSFTYAITNGAASATARVRVTVSAAGAPPPGPQPPSGPPPSPTPTPAPPPLSARDDTATTLQDRSVIVDVLANDAGARRSVTVDFVGEPGNGTARKEPDGRIKYIPNAGWSGRDSFDYGITDGASVGTARVFVDVLATPPGSPTPPEEFRFSLAMSGFSVSGNRATFTLQGSNTGPTDIPSAAVSVALVAGPNDIRVGPRVAAGTFPALASGQSASVQLAADLASGVFWRQSGPLVAALDWGLPLSADLMNAVGEGDVADRVLSPDFVFGEPHPAPLKGEGLALIRVGQSFEFSPGRTLRQFFFRFSVRNVSSLIVRSQLLRLASASGRDPDISAGSFDFALAKGVNMSRMRPGEVKSFEENFSGTPGSEARLVLAVPGSPASASNILKVQL